MILVVDVNTWYRGLGARHSRLLRHDGRMCCVGFLGKACGFTDEQLFDEGNVADVEFKTKLSLFPQIDGNRWTEAYKLNDSVDIFEADRRIKLKSWFAALNIELRFSDEEQERSDVSTDQ